MSTIDNVKSMVRDYARPNMFEVDVYPGPAAIEYIGQRITEDGFEANQNAGFFGGLLGGNEGSTNQREWQEMVKITAKAVTSPAVNIHEIPILRGGIKYSIPGDMDLSDVTLTIICDENMVTRNFFLYWAQWMMMGAISGEQEYKRNFRFADGFVSPVTKDAIPEESIMVIRSLAGNKEVTGSTVLYRCFPKTVGELSWDWDSENAFQSFTVTMGYNFFDVISSIRPQRNALSNLLERVGF